MKEKSFYSIINHSLNKDQLRDLPVLKCNGGIDEHEHNIYCGCALGYGYTTGTPVIVSPSEEIKKGLLQSPDNYSDIIELVNVIISDIKRHNIENVLCPGGSPAFNAVFNIIAEKENLRLWFSHSVREFKEIKDPDGSIKKTNIFHHIKWIIIGEENYKIL